MSFTKIIIYLVLRWLIRQVALLCVCARALNGVFWKPTIASNYEMHINVFSLLLVHLNPLVRHIRVEREGEPDKKSPIKLNFHYGFFHVGGDHESMKR